MIERKFTSSSEIPSPPQTRQGDLYTFQTHNSNYIVNKQLHRLWVYDTYTRERVISFAPFKC